MVTTTDLHFAQAIAICADLGRASKSLVVSTLFMGTHGLELYRGSCALTWTPVKRNANPRVAAIDVDLIADFIFMTLSFLCVFERTSVRPCPPIRRPFTQHFT